MNTGIQDAANLAWKLALKINAKGPNLLLNTHETERHRIGEFLLKTMDRFFAFIKTKNFFISHLRNSLLPVILPFLFSKNNIGQPLFRFISQLNIHNPKNKFVVENTKNADIAWLQTQLIMGSLASQIIFHLYGVITSAIYVVIRPDGYIGFRLFGSDLSLAENYLKILFQKNQ